jgi:hypothetical protein
MEAKQAAEGTLTGEDLEVFRNLRSQKRILTALNYGPNDEL